MLFEKAHKLVTDFCSIRINKNNSFSRYYQYSIPWIYWKTITFLRNDDKEILLIKNKKKVSLKLLFIHFILFKINKLFLLFANRVDVMFMISSPNHYKQYVEIEQVLKINGVNWAYVTNKLKIYRELKANKKNVYFLDNVNNNYLENFYVKSNNSIEFEKAMDNHIRLNSKYFVYIESQINWIIDRLSPKIFITANDLLIPHRVAVLIFKERSLPTICLQHGYISSHTTIYKEILADQFLVYGQYSKQSMLNMGFPENRIQIVGSLLFNAHLQKTSEITKTFLKLGKKNVLVAFSGAGNSTSFKHHIKQISAIGELASKLTEVHFLIKLHPKDDLAHYFKLKNDNISIVSHIEFLHRKGSFTDLISMADIMITSTSASMFDAFKLGVPVCVLDLENEYTLDNFKMGVVNYCMSVEELLINIREIFQQGSKYHSILKAKEFLAELYYTTEHSDTKTIVFDIILKLISGLNNSKKLRL